MWLRNEIASAKPSEFLWLELAFFRENDYNLTFLKIAWEHELIRDFSPKLH